MLNLSKPKVSDQVYRTELPESLNYLADGETAFLSVSCRAGGHLNPDLIKLTDDIELNRQVKTLELTDVMKDRAAYSKGISELSKDIARDRFGAIYDACVVSWETNIRNNDKPMTCDKEHFMALAEVRIDEIAAFFVGLNGFIADLSNFIAKADEEAEKN